MVIVTESGPKQKKIAEESKEQLFCFFKPFVKGVRFNLHFGFGCWHSCCPVNHPLMLLCGFVRIIKGANGGKSAMNESIVWLL